MLAANRGEVKKADQSTKDVKDSTDDLTKSLRDVTSEWDDVIGKFNEWVSITGTGYNASAIEQREYWEKVADGAKDGSEEQIAATRSMQEAETEWFEGSKLGFLEVGRVVKDQQGNITTD